jgi:hypothetical protein
LYELNCLDMRFKFRNAGGVRVAGIASRPGRMNGDCSPERFEDEPGFIPLVVGMIYARIGRSRVTRPALTCRVTTNQAASAAIK